jgi:hypothetical protein
MKTREELSLLSDEELLAYFNSLVDEANQTDDIGTLEINLKQKELFRSVWIERNGVKQDFAIHTRRQRRNF